MTLTAARAIRAFTIAVFALVVLPLQAATPDTKIPAAGPGHAAIASAYPLASEAGKQILAKGGNAFDAAVAVASALTVVESCCSGLGGGGFFLLRRASDGHEAMIDLREMAPGASTRDMYLDKDGNAVASLSRDSALAAGIPGEPAGLVYLAKKYGKLPLSVSMAPAIKLARDGFPLYERMRGAVSFKKDAFLKTADAARVFLDNGEVPAIGYIIKQPDLADSLELLATQGRRRLLQGRIREEARRRRAPARRQLDRSGPG